MPPNPSFSAFSAYVLAATAVFKLGSFFWIVAPSKVGGGPCGLVDPDVKDKGGGSALQHACFSGSQFLARCYL